MDEPAADLSTDRAWEEWGRRDPYYGVFTNPIFRREALTEAARQDFFATGETQAHHVLATIRKHIDPEFAPRQILDFGCGVGRLVVPFATRAERVVGVDVSAAMLAEARANCDARQLQNVDLLQSDDDLSSVTDTFDLVHSCIVFQHIPVARGRVIFDSLLRRLNPGGVAALQLTYSKASFAATHGVAPPESRPARRAPPAAAAGAAAAAATAAGADPEMQMNPYNMNEILFLMQGRGVHECHFEFTDHGGELGVCLYFAAPGRDP